MAAMLIIGVFCGQGQKHFSPLGTKTLISCKFVEKKFHCFDHQRGRLVMWLQAKNSAGPKVVCLSESRKKN